MEKPLKLLKEFLRELDEYYPYCSDYDIKTFQEIYILSRKLNNTIKEIQNKNSNCIPYFGKLADKDMPLFSYGQCGDNVYWKVVDEVLYIEGQGPMWNFGDDLTPPWIYNDYEVVIISNGVTTIGSYAFSYDYISEIVIPSSVKVIEEVAFMETKIEKITLPDTIETLKNGCLASEYCNIKTAIISVNIKNLEEHSLYSRADDFAEKIILTGTLPDNLDSLVNSGLFLEYFFNNKIYYPKIWETEESSFYDQLMPYLKKHFDDPIEKLKNVLIPYDDITEAE